ncbi:MAG TPA: hypothetical protein VMT00_08380 [Thermoanaerobaculia bacterium]|nr:hypothetical protein [Thermoanaerobaculia bacterium]
MLIRKLDAALEGSIYGWKAQYLFPETPFSRTLYLDPDVYVARDVSDVFGLLDHYDVGFRFFGPPLMEDKSLAYHPKCHGGVILFRRSPQSEQFFADHLALYRERVRVARDLGHSPVIDDERTWAIALARSKARPVHLDNYLAFHYRELSAFWHPPLIFHGRFRDPAAIHARLLDDWPDTTNDLDQRLWLPRLDSFIRPSARWRDPLLFAYIAIRKLFSRFARFVGL